MPVSGVIADFLTEEAKTHPRLALVLVLLLTITATMIISYGHQAWAQKDVVADSFREVDGKFAQVTEALDSLDKRLTVIEKSQREQFLEQRIATIEAEVWQLERIDATGEATARDLDRLQKLNTEYNRVNRQLQVLR